MKFLRDIIVKFKPEFEKGGKYEKFSTAFNAFDTFLFVPEHTTHKGAHIRDAIDLKRTMITVVIAMIPCLLFGMWNIGYQHALAAGITMDIMSATLFGLEKVLPMIVVSYVAGLTVEFIFASIKRHPVNEGFLVTGMLIPLVMPVNVPLWMVAAATIFAVVIGKEVFGGTGMNVLNVALTTRAFLFFAYPTKMSGNAVWVSAPQDAAGKYLGAVDGFTGATPLGELAALVDLDKGSAHAKSILEGVPDLWHSFIGTIPGSIGETSALACLIGAAILLFTGIGSWRIMVSVFAGGYVMAALFNLWGVNMFMEVSPMHQLMLGGFMFGMVFMATDPVTAAQTAAGKYIYGFLIGLLAILIRVLNPAYPEGMMLAILFMNVMAPLIDHYVIEGNIKMRMKRLKTVKA